MKRLLAFFCTLICLFSLVGCDPGCKSLNKEELLANTVRIELVDYANENPKMVRINGRKKPRFEFNKVTFIAALDESYYEDLLVELSEYSYLVFGSALNEPLGKTLVLYQSNGNMIVLFGCVYTNGKDTYYYGDCNVYDSNGVFVEHIGDVYYQFFEMIEFKYFQTTP